METFKDQLCSLINKNSRENSSNTPDYLLAEFLESCLVSYESAVNKRDRFFGIKQAPGQITDSKRTIQPAKDLTGLRKKSIACIKEVNQFFGPVEIPRTNIHFKNICHKHFINDPTGFLKEMESRNIISIKREPNDSRNRMKSFRVTL